jgi:hypothetical protein
MCRKHDCSCVLTDCRLVRDLLSGRSLAEFLKRREMQQDGERDEKHGHHDEGIQADQLVGPVYSQEMKGRGGRKHAHGDGHDEIEDSEEIPYAQKSGCVTPLADHSGGHQRCAKANDDVTHARGYGEFSGKTAHRKEDQEDDAFGTVELQADDPLLWYCLNEAPEETPPYEEQDNDRDGGEDSVLDGRNS